MDDPISISVMVPQSRISELYALCSTWLKEPEDSEEKAAGWEWGGDEAFSDAQALYRAISAPAKRILDHLIDQPGGKFSAEMLAAVLEFDSVDKLTGSLSSIARRARSAGREVPYKYDREQGRYWLDLEVAELFRQAREGVPKRRGRAHLYQGTEDVSQEEAPMPDAE